MHADNSYRDYPAPGREGQRFEIEEPTVAQDVGL